MEGAMAQGSRMFRKGELLAILGEIYHDKGTGTLVLQREQTSKFLYIQDGEFIFAASNAPEDKFTQILVERGKLTPEQLQLATEKKGTRTIGRTLVEMGFLGSEDLLNALVEQMRKIARSAVQWDEGLAVFKSGVLPANIARLPILTPRFLADTALSIHDRGWVANTLGRMETPLVISPAEREVARALPATVEELRILEQVDGQRNAREVCERAGVDAFYGARFLLALSHLGLLHLNSGFAPAPSSRTQAEPLDLSFLDEIAPSPAPKAMEATHPTLAPQATLAPQLTMEPQEETATPAEENPWARVAPLPPTPNIPLPPQEWSVLPPSPSPPAETPGLPFEVISPTPPAPAHAEVPALPPPPPPRAPSPPDLLPPPDQLEQGPQGDRGRVPFEDIGVHTGKPRGRLVLVAASFIAVLCLGTAAVWYFFLRPSEMIPLGPSEPAGSKRVAPRTSVTPPTSAPASPAPVPPVPAPSGQPPVVVSPPVDTSPTPASSATAEVATPSVPPGALPSTGAAGEGQRLMASGRYPEAALAFLGDWAQSPAGYTVEIEVACQADTVAKGAAAAAGKSELAILPYDLKGRSCYLVVWGTYPDRTSAEAALGELPSLFQPPAAQPRVASRARVLELSRGKK
jgi:hypothetical protein